MQLSELCPHSSFSEMPRLEVYTRPSSVNSDWSAFVDGNYVAVRDIKIQASGELAADLFSAVVHNECLMVVAEELAETVTHVQMEHRVQAGWGVTWPPKTRPIPYLRVHFELVRELVHKLVCAHTPTVFPLQNSLQIPLVLAIGLGWRLLLAQDPRYLPFVPYRYRLFLPLVSAGAFFLPQIHGCALKS